MELLRRYIGDPMATEDNKFFFFDETWTDPYGPFDSIEYAEKELNKYVEQFLNKQK